MDTTTFLQMPVERLIEICSDTGPSVFDIVALVTALILGVLSFALAAFVYTISQKSETRVTTILDDVRLLVAEIRQLTESGLFGQRELQNKMLDSIILSNYGARDAQTSSATLDDGQRLVDALAEIIDDKLAGVKTINTEIVDSIKSEIQRVSDESRSDTKPVVSDQLYRRISHFALYPAYAVMLNGIIRDGLTSVHDIKGMRKNDWLVEGLDVGIERLLEKEILLGTSVDFNVNPEYKSELEAFVAVNAQVIQRAENYFSSRVNEGPSGSDDRVTQESIGRQLVF